MIESDDIPQGPGFFSRLKSTFKSQLTQGLSPHGLALSFALGSTLGIMPLAWGSSLICVGLAALLKLNQAVVQGANYLVYPLQIVLFMPYMMGANQLFSSDSVPPDTFLLLAMVTENPSQFFQMFWQANLQALVLWFISSPAWISGFYLPTLLCYRHFISKQRAKN